jgi:acyl-CoA synthetase (AMP-forming)/AMP-acid ligase II
MVPIGHVLPGFEYLIHNSEISESDHKKGELLLSGPQVSNGYMNNEEQSEKSFILLEGIDSEKVWYRTGDLVSYDKKLGLLFHGRVDRQVKIRGNRVELQEVETCIRNLLGCQVVAILVNDINNVQKLIVFCETENLDWPEVRRHCLSLVPGSMVPDLMIGLAELPLNVNGKVDYNELSKMSFSLV